MLSGLAAGSLWALLAVVLRHYAPLVWTLVGANAFVVLASSVSGSFLVETGTCARLSVPSFVLPAAPICLKDLSLKFGILLFYH